MSDQATAVVIGGGVVGASTLFHLVELGGVEATMLERDTLASGGTGKSCAIVRTHYSIPSNTELAVGSLAMFKDLKGALDDREADSGFVNSGYLILAPEGETAARMLDNLEVQRAHGANTHAIGADEALALHPLLDLADVGAIGWEPESGYADPHLTTTSFVNAAVRRGAQVRQSTRVEEVLVTDGRVVGVRTGDGVIAAELVISVVGPWTRSLTDPLGIDVPLQNSRHTVLTLRGPEPYRRDLPIVKDLTVENKMYFRPESGMILVGTGDHGDDVDDPDDMTVQPAEDLVVRQGTQIARRVPSFADAEIVRSWFGPYDITPDWNPVLDQPPGVKGLYLAFGFSGHGFKLAPMVGRVLAQMALGESTDIDVSAYGLARFVEERPLAGAYGIGSIS